MCIENESSGYTKREKVVSKRCIFPLDLFHLYGKMMLRELEDIAGFISGGYKQHNDINRTHEIALMSNSEGKLT